MKRTVAAIALCLSLAVPLAACGASQNASTQQANTAESSRANYTETELKLFAAAEDVPDAVSVRFYDDLPSVPYIGLAHYMSLVSGDNAKVEVADGVATITSTDGGVAVINDTEDTLTSDNWESFHNYLEPMQQGIYQGFLDTTAPFCRIAEIDYGKQEKHLVFDLSKYGIDLHVDEDDAYLPLATASDLMTDSAYDNLAYNGRELYLLRGFDDDPTAVDPAWFEPLIADEPRAEDMADFAYRELCFVFDNRVFCTGKEALAEEVAAKGLDTALLEKDELTQRIRELLQSTDKAEYNAGLTGLWVCFTNGHTQIKDPGFMEAVQQEQGLNDRIDANKKEIINAFYAKDYAKKVEEVSSLTNMQAGAQRSEIWPDGASYHELGDTAVISTGNFLDYDEEGWKAFYAGTGARPDGSGVPDYIGTLITNLERAKSNPEIKNVVIDSTTNNGGSNDLCATALALLTGKASTPIADAASGVRYSLIYEIDSLFDGGFDTDAAASGCDFNYAILTCCNSWSSGNYFPSLLRDAGIPVIGERSSGGSNMVFRSVSPEGYRFSLSDGFVQLTDAKGNGLEDGVPVDVELVGVKEDGSKDYSAFYDIARLSEVMHELYPEEQ